VRPAVGPQYPTMDDDLVSHVVRLSRAPMEPHRCCCTSLLCGDLPARCRDVCQVSGSSVKWPNASSNLS
jgi:hypothetical protein